MRIVQKNILLAIFTCTVLGCTSKKEISGTALFGGFGDCMFKETGKTSQNTFPFNKADKITLVSFENGIGPALHLENDQLNHPDFLQSIKLDQSSSDSLFNLLFGYASLDGDSLHVVRDCYSPHHAIIFHHQNTTIAFLEICFDCSNTRSSHYMGDFCEGKIRVLQDFFDSKSLEI